MLFKTRLIAYTLLLVLPLSLAFAEYGDIGSGSNQRYSWGDMSGFWDLNNNSGGLILQRGSGSVHTLSGYMYSEDFGWASADGPNHTSQIAEYRMDYDGSEKVIGCFEGEMFSENGGFVQLNPSQVTACTEGATITGGTTTTLYVDHFGDMSGYIWSENMGWVEIGGFSSTASGGIGTGYNAMVDAGAFRPDNTVPSASISTPSSSGSYFSGSFMDFAGTFYDTDSGVDGSTALYTIIPGNITGALLTAGDVGTTENFSTGIVFADLGMTDGSYEISVSTDDVVGNTQISTTATTFHIDTIGPESDSFSIDGGATYASGVSVELATAATDTGAGVSSIKYSCDNTTWSDWDSYATTKTFDITTGSGCTGGDGTKSVHVQYKDAIGNTGSIVSGSIILDTTAPVGSISYDITAATSGSVVATLATTDSGSVTITNNSASNTYTFTSNGNFEFTYIDAAGNTNTTTATVGNIDSDGPSVTGIVIDSGNQYTTASSVSIAHSGSDIGGNTLSHMRFSCDDTTWSDWEGYNTSKSWDLETGSGCASGDGAKTVYVQYKDNLGNTGSSVSDPIALDTTAPETHTISINSDSSTTNNADVTLTLSSTDTLSGIASMDFSCDATSWSGWESYSTSKSWNLETGMGCSSGDGTKTVYVRFQDNAGNITANISDTIDLDTVSPSVSVNIPAGEYTGTQTIILDTGDVSDIIYYVVSTNSTPDFTSTSSGNSSVSEDIWPTDPVVSKYLHYYAEDTDGNTGAVVTKQYDVGIYKPVPEVSSISTALGTDIAQVDAQVTVTGTGFLATKGAGGSITLGGVSLTTSSWNNTTIVATLPSSISLDSELVITNDYSKTDTYTDFSVVGAPGSISISPSTTISLTKGDSTTLSAILRDENGVTLDGASFVWSDNTSGMVTLTDANTDTVTITADDVVNGTIDVTSQGITQLVTVNVSGTSNAEIVSCVQPGGVKLDWTNGAGIDAVTMNDVILEEIKAYDGISINNIVLATNANSGSFITNDVYAGSSIISKVYLDAHNSVGNGIDIDYEITVDSGATWKTATSGEQITFATGGTDIRLRSTLQRLTSDLRPEIYYARLVFGDFDLNEGKSFKEKLDASLPGNYVYSTKNCSTSSYQIGSLRNVNGIWMAAVEGSYSVQGGDDQYIDPGTIGVYDQETDEYLLTKYLKLNLVQ